MADPKNADQARAAFDQSRSAYKLAANDPTAPEGEAPLGTDSESGARPPPDDVIARNPGLVEERFEAGARKMGSRRKIAGLVSVIGGILFVMVVFWVLRAEQPSPSEIRPRISYKNRDASFPISSPACFPG